MFNVWFGVLALLNFTSLLSGIYHHDFAWVLLSGFALVICFVCLAVGPPCS